MIDWSNALLTGVAEGIVDDLRRGHDAPHALRIDRDRLCMGIRGSLGNRRLASRVMVALAHWLLAGMVLPMMDRMNPCVKDRRIKAFGAYGNNYGAMMVAGFVAGHLLFGAVVGWLYSVPRM